MNSFFALHKGLNDTETAPLSVGRRWALDSCWCADALMIMFVNEPINSGYGLGLALMMLVRQPAPRPFNPAPRVSSYSLFSARSRFGLLAQLKFPTSTNDLNGSGLIDMLLVGT